MKKEIKVEIKEIIKNSNHPAQKKYLSNQKQLRVWLDAEKFENFKAVASLNNISMHRLINDYIDEYLFQHRKENITKKDT